MFARVIVLVGMAKRRKGYFLQGTGLILAGLRDDRLEQLREAFGSDEGMVGQDASELFPNLFRPGCSRRHFITISKHSKAT